MKYGFIYITENLINGKRYLGLKTYKGRWKQYLGSGKLLRKAIKKYGASNFKRTIIYEADSKDELDSAEKRFIAEYNAVNDPMWYNLVKGGFGVSLGFKGKRHTKERNEALSAKLKGHAVSDKVRQHAASLGKLSSQNRAARAKQAAAISGEKHFRAKSILIDGIKYPTLTAASKSTGLSPYKVRQILQGSL